MTLWPQALKSLVFALLLLWANADNGIFWPVVFTAVSAYFYFQPMFEWKKFFYIFLVIFFYSIGVIGYFSNSAALLGMALVFGAALFVLLGIKNFLFLERGSKLNILCSFLYFMIAAVFFVADKTSWPDFAFYFLISFAAFYSVFKEFIDFSYPDFPKTKKSLIIAGSAFLMMELVVAVSFLPIGFLNSSALILLFVFVLEEFIFYHLKGNLNRQAILNNVTILIVAIIFIFATSRWGL